MESPCSSGIRAAVQPTYERVNLALKRRVEQLKDSR